jgi:hypothetical protein
MDYHHSIYVAQPGSAPIPVAADEAIPLAILDGSLPSILFRLPVDFQLSENNALHSLVRIFQGRLGTYHHNVDIGVPIATGQ